MAAVAIPGAADAIPARFPASTSTTAGSIDGVSTTVTRISFSDKILLTISQAGRLNHWLHVPLTNTSLAENSLTSGAAYTEIEEDNPDSTLLPYSHLTATTVLGGTKPDFEILGQTIATNIASAILMRQAEEQRMLVVGLGLEKADSGRAGFEELIGLCLDVL